MIASYGNLELFSKLYHWKLLQNSVVKTDCDYIKRLSHL